MKVLIVSQYFWPESFRINALVKSLVEQGLEVDVLTGKPNYPEGAIFEGYKAWGTQKEVWCGATIYRVPLFPRGRNSAIRLALNYLSFMLSGVVLAPWLFRHKKYDIVFAYSVSPILLAIPGILISRLRHIPFILWLQDLWPESLSATRYVENKIALGMVEEVVGWIYRRCDLILIQSRAFRSAVKRINSNVRVSYYPNSVDPSFSLPPNPKIELPNIEAFKLSFTVVFAGNVGAAQSVSTIIQAANILRKYTKIQFVVIGQGSKWKWLEAEIQRLELTNVFLPGRFPEDVMPGLLQQADALLVTLTNEPIFTLTVPNKIQAYMATGRPILACLNGEGARLVEEAGAGFAINAEDSQGLADAILRLYEMDPGERAAFGNNGRKFFHKNFDHDVLVKALIDIMQNILEKKVS